MHPLPLPAPAMAVLLVGAASCVAGIWMLLHRRAQVAGGPLLLLIGMVLLALSPWLREPEMAALEASPVAVAPVEVAPVEVALGPVSLSADGQRTVVRPPTPAPPPPLPGREATRIAIEASEIEPNDSLPAANLAGIGTAVTGTLTAGNLDYFAIDMPDGTRGDFVAGLLVLTGDAGLTVFDEAGRPLGSADTNNQIAVRTTLLERLIDGPRFYVLVRGVPAGAEADYRLTLAVRRR